MPRILLVLATVVFGGVVRAANLAAASDPAVPALVALSAPNCWEPLDFRLDNAPVAKNPFDPDELRLDATFTAPSGKQYVVPVFWYQDFRRIIVGKESLAPVGTPEWRVRFTATEPGEYHVVVKVQVRDGEARELTASRFTVADRVGRVDSGGNASARGWVTIGQDHRTFATTDGQTLRLSGQNVCWPQAGGTFDYDRWFDALQRTGQNVARLWMAPWWAPLEHVPGTLNNYRLDAAWEMDHVFRAAEARGIYLVFCFEHHGMFQEDNLNWGGSNNFWSRNPYNEKIGGPCSSPNDFFVNPRARALYEKKLRYLIGRYGNSPYLLAWEFFNEIDNVYPHLRGEDVAAWHRDVGRWMHAHDPYGHLVSTSLTGGSDRPEIWNIPELDFAMYHSYADVAPARSLAKLAQQDTARYGKPMWIGEFGTSARAWEIQGDPHLRGFRQGLWGGALGGSAGTAAPWWWEDIYASNANAYFATLNEILRRAGVFPSGEHWQPVDFVDPGSPPAEVGALEDAGAPFDVTVLLGGTYRTAGDNVAALADPLCAARAAERLNHYLRPAGTHPLAKPMRISAWFGANAQLTAHVDSVSQGAELVVRVDGTEVGRTALPDKDGKSRVAKEYDADFTYPISPGRHLVELDNVGRDWVFLDHLRITQLRPAKLADRWSYRPELIGLRQGDRAVVYVVSPWTVWPANAKVQAPPLIQRESVTLQHWPAGEYQIEWYSPTTGIRVAVNSASGRAGVLDLALPDFTDDLAAIITRVH